MLQIKRLKRAGTAAGTVSWGSSAGVPQEFRKSAAGAPQGFRPGDEKAVVAEFDAGVLASVVISHINNTQDASMPPVTRLLALGTGVHYSSARLPAGDYIALSGTLKKEKNRHGKNS